MYSNGTAKCVLGTGNSRFNLTQSLMYSTYDKTNLSRFRMCIAFLVALQPSQKRWILSSGESSDRFPVQCSTDWLEDLGLEDILISELPCQLGEVK